MVAFSYGAAASSFLSRGVRLASDAGSIVDCMQPPRTTPAPNRTTNNPLTAIVLPLSRSPLRAPAPKHLGFQLTEKAAPMLCFRRIRAHLPVNLLQECRTAPRHPRRKFTFLPTP